MFYVDKCDTMKLQKRNMVKKRQVIQRQAQGLLFGDFEVIPSFLDSKKKTKIIGGDFSKKKMQLPLRETLAICKSHVKLMRIESRLFFLNFWAFSKPEDIIFFQMQLVSIQDKISKIQSMIEQYQFLNLQNQEALSLSEMVHTSTFNLKQQIKSQIELNLKANKSSSQLNQLAVDSKESLQSRVSLQIPTEQQVLPNYQLTQTVISQKDAQENSGFKKNRAKFNNQADIKGYSKSMSIESIVSTPLTKNINHILTFNRSHQQNSNQNIESSSEKTFPIFSQQKQQIDEPRETQGTLADQKTRHSSIMQYYPRNGSMNDIVSFSMQSRPSIGSSSNDQAISLKIKQDNANMREPEQQDCEISLKSLKTRLKYKIAYFKNNQNRMGEISSFDSQCKIFNSHIKSQKSEVQQPEDMQSKKAINIQKVKDSQYNEGEVYPAQTHQIEFDKRDEMKEQQENILDKSPSPSKNIEFVQNTLHLKNINHNTRYLKVSSDSQYHSNLSNYNSNSISSHLQKINSLQSEPTSPQRKIQKQNNNPSLLKQRIRSQQICSPLIHSSFLEEEKYPQFNINSMYKEYVQNHSYLKLSQPHFNSQSKQLKLGKQSSPIYKFQLMNEELAQNLSPKEIKKENIFEQNGDYLQKDNMKIIQVLQKQNSPQIIFSNTQKEKQQKNQQAKEETEYQPSYRKMLSPFISNYLKLQQHTKQGKYSLQQAAKLPMTTKYIVQKQSPKINYQTNQTDNFSTDFFNPILHNNFNIEQDNLC